jgi:hypothetical protein
MADKQALHEFSRWVAGCSGNEKQEARTFIEKLLRAWGWEDSTEAEVCFEEPVRKGGAGGGIGYADALIKGKVLIEMKSRGEHLGVHAGQLQRYWFNLTPKPTYAVLCNFDEFWVYDFNQLVDEPVDAFRTEKIAERWTAIAFFSKTPEKVLFGNNQVEVTERQAKAMGGLFYELKEQAQKTEAFTELQAQRFVLQCVLCMFAEDREMLPSRKFSLALEACKEKGESTYDVLSALFNEMNTPGVTPGGRFQGTPYFNGGLFAEIPRIELSPSQLDMLVLSAQEDWKSVRPSIFGNIFEASSDQARRHSLGQHFTSEPDILKVVRPTIIEPWEERLEAARNIAEVEAILFALQQFRVLDPACGSGNFLYMGYNALKDLEAKALKNIQDRRKAEALKGQVAFGFVTTNQFYGMDTDPFAVELARVTLMIARKVAHDRLGLTEQELPLDNLDKNIIQADALFENWPEADAIIGNPPFLGGKRIRAELGNKYIEAIFETFPDTHNFADLCCYWFRRAHEKVKNGARAGLVGTNMVRRGYNRRASLDYITQNGGHIHDAVSSQQWSGDASVHVSIVNWSSERPNQCKLDGELVKEINSFLKDTVDTSDAIRLKSNSGRSFIGVQPTGKGFEVADEEGEQWIRANPRNREVLRRYLIAKDLARNPNGKPSCWIIDFNEMTLEEAEEFQLPFKKVVADVKPQRDKVRREHVRKYWWKLQERRQGMRTAILKEGGMFAFPYTSKWFVALAPRIDDLPANTVTVISGSDLYLLGVLSSWVHRTWIHAQKSTLEDRTRYTPTSCFETYPFPQLVTAEQAEAVRKAMTELNDYREGWMTEKQKGITDLYNRYFDEPASKLSQLHKTLDAAVLKAYGWKESEDLLSNLLDLNLELAEREENGLAVVGPWDPNR